MARLADFLIIGAPRSGTTWLYKVLSHHPDIRLATPIAPEPKFFLVDEEYRKGIGHYAKLFVNAPDDAVVGEKSTNYLESATAAQRAGRDVPDAKIIVMLREPAERAFSNWRWSRSNGLEDESFKDALEREPVRESSYPARLRYARPFSYASRGRYAQLLGPWLDTFGRQQMLVEDFYQIAADPAGLLNRVHTFLGVATRGEDARTEGTVNAAPFKDTADSATMRRLRASFRADNARLVELLGDAAPEWARFNGGRFE